MSLEFDATLRLGAFTCEASFEARDEIVVLFGHSGAGKSVTLQAIAGLLRPEHGRIAINGRAVYDSEQRIDLQPQARLVGYVVQDLALFPHMTVAQNIAFGMAPANGASRRERVERLLTALRLEAYGDRRPRSLSGGQQQRVALARALGRDAQLLLLDEPFSALDDSLRAEFRRELVRLRAERGLTIVFVTHDLREAHLLADRLAVFDAGRILQFDEREAVFRRPVSRRVAELTGVANIFPGQVAGFDLGRPVVEIGGLPLRCASPPGEPAPGHGHPVDVCIRAERVILHRGPPRSGVAENLFEAAIVEEFAYGASHTLRLEPVGVGPALEAEVAARPYEVLGIAARRDWTVELPSADLHVMRR